MVSHTESPPAPRTHAELLERFGSNAQVSTALERFGFHISGGGVQRWSVTRIPGEYWHALATLADELEVMGYVACLKMLAQRSSEDERRRHEANASEPAEATG